MACDQNGSLQRLVTGLEKVLAVPSSADHATSAKRYFEVLKAAAEHLGCSVQSDGSITPPSAAKSHFAAKTDQGSAELFFHYYGLLQHQQNMLQDHVRTGTYYAAFLENQSDFAGKVVMDVGAGSGILSQFAAQAGAAKVYAVEASDMAEFAATLASNNTALGQRIQVVHGKVEEVDIGEHRKVDVLVSEPMGTLLVNERMLETYIYARNRFLKPGGRMFPRLGRIHVAAFSDEVLYAELLSKAQFWQQNNFYGVDVTSLHRPAVSGYFGQVVVDAVDAATLVSNCATRVFDFITIEEEELHDIIMPLQLQIGRQCVVHGICCWFDVLFDGSTQQRWLSTAPGLPTTHWFQLRCVVQQPLQASPGSVLTGQLRLKAHNRQSYDITAQLQLPPMRPGQPPQQAQGQWDLKEPYYRQLNSWVMPEQTAPQQTNASHNGQQPQSQYVSAVNGSGQGIWDDHTAAAWGMTQ